MAKARSEFNEKYKWNVKDLYENNEEVLKDLEYVENKLKCFEKFKGHILDSSLTLEQLLQLDMQLSEKIERLYIYGHINNDADTTNTAYQELFGKIKNVYVKYLETTSFIVPELLESDYSIIQKYLNENKNLKEYARMLKEIYRSKEHILSKEEEKIISAYSEVLSSSDDIMGSLTDSDLKFKPIKVAGKKVELNESNYSIYIKHNDRDVRKSAFTNLHKTYGEFKNTLAKTLSTEVKKNVVSSKLRGFKNSLAASLFNDEIDESVYHNLIEGVHNNLDVLYAYWNLKKRLLGVPDLHIYDTYASLNNDGDETYSFDEAKDLVLKAVTPLGGAYVKDISKSFRNKWIDSCNNIGKRGGAYCTSCYSVHPYVLLSYEGKISDVSTLAHELGHAMHYYYACQNQKYQDYGYSIFVAEVASQVNEILLSQYLLDSSSKKSEKIKIIDDLLQKFKSTIFRQTMFAEFELFIHEFTEQGGVLTHENMCSKYFELNKLYYGDGVHVDDLIKYEWERIPHFYMNFYVWQYATGFAASVKIANDIYNKNIEARDKYLEFLKLGATKNPIDSLKVAGVDMTKKEVLDDAIKYMKELIKEYEKILKENE